MDPRNYSRAFLRAIAFILPHEEEFARGHWGDEKFVVCENVSGDGGGLTKYGIDQASHPGVDIAGLTRDGAIALYWILWTSHKLDALPEKIATAMMDVWVNGGHAVLWLQRALRKVCGAAIDADGAMGPATITAAQTHDVTGVVSYFLQERDERFRAIVANHPSQQKFLDGWLQRDRDLAKLLAA